MKSTSTFILTTLLYGSSFAQPGTFDPTFNDGNFLTTVNFASELQISSSGNESAWLTLTGGYDVPVPPYTTVNGGFGSLTNDIGTSTASTNTTHSVVTSGDIKFLTDFSLTSDNKLVITGHYRTNYMDATEGMYVARFNPTSGVIDPTFNTGNYYTIESSGSYYAQQVEVLSDNKILVAGYETLNNFFVRSLNADGTMDTGFGTLSGTANFTVFGNGPKSISDMRVLSNGKILLAGYDFNNTLTLSQGFVARLNSDGSLDNTFGTNGITIVDFSDNSYINSIDLTPTGEIILAGYYKDNISNISTGAMIKLTSDGQIDTNFPQPYVHESGSVFTKLKILSTGKILVSGVSPSGVFFLFNSDGTIDNTFATNGTAGFSFTGIGSYIQVEDFDIQSDGKVIFVAMSSAPYTSASHTGRMLMSAPSNGLEDNNSNFISIYPNPAKETLSIKSSYPCDFIITSINGKVVYQSTFETESIIDLSTFESGVYFIRTSEGQTTKFIKE